MRRLCLACVSCFLLPAAVAWGSTLAVQASTGSRSARVSATHMAAITAAKARATSIMFGNRVVAQRAAAVPAGLARAFPFRSRITGTVSAINVYLDRRSHADGLLVGVYSDARGKPGLRLTDAPKTSPKSGAWNSVRLAPAKITSGSTYWLVVLSQGGPLLTSAAPPRNIRNLVSEADDLAPCGVVRWSPIANVSHFRLRAGKGGSHACTARTDNAEPHWHLRVSPRDLRHGPRRPNGTRVRTRHHHPP